MTRVTPWTGERIRLAAIGGISLIVLGIMAWPIFTGQVYASDDLGWFHIPLRAFHARCLAAGEDPSWCPDLFAGFYLHGEGQVGLSHPWHIFLYRYLPLSVAFNLELLVNYPITLLGVYLLLRAHRLPSDAALLGGFLFSFAGYHLLHFRHVNSISILAHLPWLLLASRYALLEAGRDVNWARLAVGLLTTSQLLIGHPQTVWYSGLAELAYAVGTAWYNRRGAGPWIAWAIAKTLGVLGGAIQWVPTLEAVRDSIRESPTLEAASIGSLHPLNFLQPLAPYLFSARVYGPAIPGLLPYPAFTIQDWRAHEYGLYLGAATPVLLAWLALRRRHIVHGRRLALAAMLLALPALIVAVGGYTPIYGVLTRVPLVGYFRVPARYLVLVHLAAALAAAVAYADLCRLVERKETTPRRLGWLWSLPVAALVIVFVAPWASRIGLPKSNHAALGSYGQRLTGVLLTLLATLCVVRAGLLARRPQWPPRLLLGLVVLLTADVGYYALSFMRDHSIRPIDHYVNAPGPPSGPTKARIRQVGTPENALVGSGYALVDGYVALTPKRALPTNHPLTARLAGVAWETSTIKKNQPWSPLPESLPVARLVAFERPTQDPSDLARIDLSTTALVEPGRDVDLPPGPPGSAQIKRWRTTQVEVGTNAPDTRLLVIAMAYHPGWKIQIDGTPVDTLRVNADYLGCHVPAGEHRVTLAFAPASLARGRALSLAGLALLVGWTIARLARPNSPSNPASFALACPHGDRSNSAHPPASLPTTNGQNGTAEPLQ